MQCLEPWLHLAVEGVWPKCNSSLYIVILYMQLKTVIYSIIQYIHYTSLYLSSYFIILYTVPSVPRLLSVTHILSDGFELHWLPPREPNGRPVYEIEYGTDDTNFTTVDTRGQETYYNLTGLQQNTTYYIRVVAVNYLTFGGLPLRGNESEIVTGIVPGEDLYWWAAAFKK